MFCSYLSYGRRKKVGTDGIVPCLLEQETTDVQFRKNWSRLIQKIYEVDPLVCPKCRGKMRVVTFIEDPDVIKKILKHLNLWDPKRPERLVDHASPLIESPTYDDPVTAFHRRLPSPTRFISWMLTPKNRSALLRWNIPKSAEIMTFCR